MAAVLGLVGVMAGPPSIAHADAALRSSDPPDGASLAEAPATVTLTFNEAVQPRFLTLTLTTDAGASVALAAASAKQAVVTQSLPIPLAPGGYVLGYRVGSADGHPVSGMVRFSIASPTPTAPPSSSPGGFLSVPTSSTAVAPVLEDAANELPPGGTPAWPWFAGAAVLLATAGAVGWAVSRRRRPSA